MDWINRLLHECAEDRARFYRRAEDPRSSAATKRVVDLVREGQRRWPGGYHLYISPQDHADVARDGAIYEHSGRSWVQGHQLCSVRVRADVTTGNAWLIGTEILPGDNSTGTPGGGGG